jgi:hypothetical protein
MALATRYSTDFRVTDIIRRGVTTTLRCAMYRGGSLVVPVSGTISVYDEAGTTIVSAAAVTVADGVATYAVLGSATSALDLGDGWRVSWSLTMPDGIVHVAENNAILARHVPHCPVSERDIWSRVPSLHPDSSGRISTRRDYSTTIDDAWVQIQDGLISRGRRHELIVTATQLREVTLLLCLALIFEDLAAGMQDGSAMRLSAADYRRQYAAAWANLSFDYDDDDDGTPDKRSAPPKTVWLY